MRTSEDLTGLLRADSFLVNPLPVLDELREDRPVFWNAVWGVWVLTRHDDVIAVLKDHTTFSSERRFSTLLARLPESIQPRIQRLRRHYSYGLIQSDPPTHTRLRLMVRDAFTPRAMQAFRPRVIALTDDLIDRFAPRGTVELMDEFAYMLPISVMCDLMGVPASDRGRFLEWDQAISGVQSTASAEADRAVAANDAIVAIEDYFTALGRKRRKNPGNDLISAMVVGHDGLEPLGDEELMAMCVGLLLGGHETTRSLLGSMVLQVLVRPKLMTQVRDRPEMGSRIVEEILRFEGPIQRGWRRVTREVQVRNETLRPDDLVYLMLGAANRDPDRFEAPDEFREERHPNNHLGFGYGIHFCVGAPLARLEGTVALERLTSRLPNMRLAGNPTWLPSIHQRTLARLDITFDPAPVGRN